MADRSKIEWTDATWNVVTGCTRVSEACQHCYAEALSRRFGWPWDVRTHPERLGWPLRWKRPRRVFACSMGDLFHEDVPFAFIGAVFRVMTLEPLHTYQVLTKRPERMLEFVTKWLRDGSLLADCDHIWLGVTAENQARADERIPVLLKTPAAVRFVSVEPMLEALRLTALKCGEIFDAEGAPYYDALAGRSYWRNGDYGIGGPRLDWIIAGGETGPGARPMHPSWVLSLRDQCQAAGVPMFFKQWGAWEPTWGSETHLVYPDGRFVEGTHEHPDAWRKKIAQPIWKLRRPTPERLMLSELQGLPRQFPEVQP